MVVAVIQVHMLLGLLASGKTEMKGIPHGQKGKAPCDVRTFAVRESTRMTQDKHFHYENKAEQMQSGQTLGLERDGSAFLSESMDHAKMDVNPEHETEDTFVSILT